MATLTKELESLRERLGVSELISLRPPSEHLAATGYGEFNRWSKATTKSRGVAIGASS